MSEQLKKQLEVAVQDLRQWKYRYPGVAAAEKEITQTIDKCCATLEAKTETDQKEVVK